MAITAQTKETLVDQLNKAFPDQEAKVVNPQPNGDVGHVGISVYEINKSNIKTIAVLSELTENLSIKRSGAKITISFF